MITYIYIFFVFGGGGNITTWDHSTLRQVFPHIENPLQCRKVRQWAISTHHVSGGEFDGIMAYAIRGAVLDPTQPVFLNTTNSSASMAEKAIQGYYTPGRGRSLTAYLPLQC